MNETSLKSTNKVFCFNSKGTGKAKKLSKTVQLKKKKLHYSMFRLINHGQTTGEQNFNYYII